MYLILLFIGFSLVGWIALIAGISARRRWQRKLEQERTRATGVVVDYADKSGGKGALCTPIIQFTAESQVVRLPCKGRFEREQTPVGRTLDILYDADDPTRFHPDSAVDLVPGRGLIVTGLIWIAAALLLTGLLAGPAGRPGPIKLTGPSKVVAGKKDPKVDAGSFRFTLKEGGVAELTGYSGSETSLTLPLIIDGHLVTGMATSAFSGNRSLERVRVSGLMRAISPGAFSGCISLREVVLSDGVQTIGGMAFSMCPLLKDVTIPASVTRIEKDAFPEDCAATFHVAADSVAERYCNEHGFTVEMDG